MKNTLSFLVPFSLLGLLSGCTGGSPPGLHKTRERPSAAVEPALEKTEKGTKEVEKTTSPGADSKKAIALPPKGPTPPSTTPPVDGKK